MAYSLDISVLWSTVSNALARSKKTAPHRFPCSIFNRTSSAKFDNAAVVDNLERKPNCLLQRRLFELRNS